MVEKVKIIYNTTERYLIMDNTIVFYELNGKVKNEELLNEENIKHTNGMMIKCHMKDGKEETGFSDSYCFGDNNCNNSNKEYINLATFDNLDEDKHELIGDDDSKYNQTFKRVNIKDIIRIEAILHSNPRWGGRLTNRFDYFVSRFANNK